MVPFAYFLVGIYLDRNCRNVGTIRYIQNFVSFLPVRILCNYQQKKCKRLCFSENNYHTSILLHTWIIKNRLTQTHSFLKIMTLKYLSNPFLVSCVFIKTFFIIFKIEDVSSSRNRTNIVRLLTGLVRNHCFYYSIKLKSQEEQVS